MLEQLKKLAMQKLQEKMAANSLNENATQEAAQEGAGVLISALTEKLGSGKLDEVKELFSNEGRPTQDNPIFGLVKGKLQEVLQNKGMNAEEAISEAQNVAPDLINNIKDKFLSRDESSKAFDLDQLSGLLGADTDNLLNMAKGFFKG